MIEIFHLYDYDSYKFKLGRQRVCHLDYINELDEVNVTRSGIGWPNWDGDRDIYENILSICRKKPDIVIGYINNNTQTYILQDFARLPILKMLMFIELRDKLKKKVKIAKPDSLIYAYPQDEDKNILPNTRWYCLSNAVASPVFCSYIPFNDRDIDICIYGAANMRVYPLRLKMIEAMCRLSDKFNCYIHPNPGARIINANTNEHLADLSRILNRSKITCTCSSIYRCRVNKFSEIPMCGSVICGDMPTVLEHKAGLRNCMIEVSSDANVYDIEQSLCKVLSNKKLLFKKHQLSLKYSSHYSVQKYSNRLLDIIKKEING